MKTLDTITLPDGMQWIDRYQAAPVAQEVAETLGGTPLLFARTLSGQRPITLEAGEEGAWLDGETVAALAELAAGAGNTFTLNWEGEAFTVLFRHQEPPALQVVPLWPGADRYTATLRLMTP